MLLANCAMMGPTQYRREAPENTAYESMIITPEKGLAKYRSTTVYGCNHFRVETILANPGAELVEDCRLVRTGGEIDEKAKELLEPEIEAPVETRKIFKLNGTIAPYSSFRA